MPRSPGATAPVSHRFLMPFKNLFRSSHQSKDGLTQAAREAIVDVLHYCMYADKLLTVREDEFIEAAARTLDWDPNISYESYEAKSTGAVTRALSNPAARTEFLHGVKARLPGQQERELALALADDLMRTDGSKSTSEAATLSELQALLR